MKGIGCDIIEIDRVAQVLERHGPAFLKKTFTPKEQEYCLQKRDPAPHFAARFAAKEAVSKALGCGFGEALSFLDVEILNSSSGKPEAHLSAEAQERHGFPTLHLTISHSKAYATAFCLAL